MKIPTLGVRTSSCLISPGFCQHPPGKKSSLYFFRTYDKKEIDLLIEREGVLYPIEVKKSASPDSSDARNFSSLDPVAADEVPAELAMFKRKIGAGCIICMVDDAFPVSSRAWALPSQAV